MKNITTIILTLTIGIFFLGGCSGKSSSTADNNETNGTTSVAMPSCGTGDDMGKSVAVSVNRKTIEKTEDDAEVRIWHYPDGKKSACMITGEATLVDAD